MTVITHLALSGLLFGLLVTFPKGNPQAKPISTQDSKLCSRASVYL